MNRKNYALTIILALPSYMLLHAVARSLSGIQSFAIHSFLYLGWYYWIKGDGIAPPGGVLAETS